MTKPTLHLADVRPNLHELVRPRVVAFNRLEARPRTLDFTRSLRAEVRDPLWLLTRQWQFGEFAGEDAASPVASRIGYREQPIDRVAFHGSAPFQLPPTSMPLETRVERERVPLVVHGPDTPAPCSDVLFAVQWGLRFRRMLLAAGLGDADLEPYLDRFPIRVRNEAHRPDPSAAEVAAVAHGRVADGVALWRAVVDGLHDPWVDTLGTASAATLKSVAADFAAFCSRRVERVFSAPAGDADTAWRPDHLEYGFTAAAPPAGGTQTVLGADQYHGGHLDWFSFDVIAGGALPLDTDEEAGQPAEQVRGFIPAAVRYRGQPQARFWEMEETAVNFGRIDTSATGLLHLMLAEFGLIYSNDWFMMPLPLEINTVCEVRGIVVDDTFGRHTFIRQAGRGPESAWQRWAMFHLTERDASQPSASRFYLPPALGKVLESEPLERVNFIRDEMANMVWAVERTVPSQTGRGMSGDLSEEPAGPPARLDDEVAIGYDLGSRMPLHWIPFIAVHIDGSVSEIRLQRARMAGGRPARGAIVGGPRSPYFVEEEEVPRAGVIVERSWQRARWLLGRTFVWVGRKKMAGRGEGWSQLQFDRVVDLGPKATP